MERCILAIPAKLPIVPRTRVGVREHDVVIGASVVKTCDRAVEDRPPSRDRSRRGARSAGR